MYDSTYGDSWNGYSVSDITVSDQTYHDLSSGLTYAQNGDHGNVWSDQNIQRNALTAGDTIKGHPFTYPDAGDYGDFWGSIAGRILGTVVGGPVGGSLGDAAGGHAGRALGDSYENNYGPNNR